MKKNLITVIGFIFCSALLYAVFISPQYQGATIRYEYIGQLNDALSQINQLQQYRDTLLAQKNSIPAEQQRLIDRQVSPHTSDGVVTFILSLNELLALNGFSSVPYEIETIVAGSEGDIVLLPISFTLERYDYMTALSFISMFERWERGVRVVSVHIRQHTGELSDPSQVDMTLVIQTLFSGGGEKL